MPVSDADLDAALGRLVAGASTAGGRVTVVVPDGTRSMPLRRVAASLDGHLRRAGAGAVMWLVALGTHQPMGDALAGHLGPVAGTVAEHAWWDPAALALAGTVPAGEVAALTGGRLRGAVPVRLNRLVLDADVVLLVGPVFPHEVAGFSGGTKYLVPGVAGAEVIDATHWLGALLTSSAVIGVEGPNPVRALIDRAAGLVPGRVACAALVVGAGGEEVVHVAVGGPGAAWAEAAAVSAATHVRWLDRPVTSALSVMPGRYQDLWTAAKGVYKVEPVVADGGEVTVYAPHVRQVSATHGEALARVGYHVRDFFTGQWADYADVPGAVLAHATHVVGAGTWSPAGGERRRIRVVLATGIDEATCRAHGLGWRDPATVDVGAAEAAAASDPGLLVVRDAGEALYRLRPA